MLGNVIPWVVGPFFGQTPGTYFAHHMGMHHVEENMAEDLSSTIVFQRDSFADWLRYWGRFMTVGLVDLAQYLARKNPQRLRPNVLPHNSALWTAPAAPPRRPPAAP